MTIRSACVQRVENLESRAGIQTKIEEGLVQRLEKLKEVVLSKRAVATTLLKRMEALEKDAGITSNKAISLDRRIEQLEKENHLGPVEGKSTLVSRVLRLEKYALDQIDITTRIGLVKLARKLGHYLDK